MTHVRFREPISGYSVTMPCYQWGQTEGVEYLERMLGTTPHGVVYREKFRNHHGEPFLQRMLQVLFEQTDDTIHQLRTLSWFAMKNAGQVEFYPDADDLFTYWLVDWQLTVEVERVIDNHLTIELTLIEIPTIQPAPKVQVAQAVIEVFLRHDAVHLGQAVVEVVVRGNTVYVGQSAVEVMAQGSAATPVQLGQAVVEVMIKP